MKKIILIISILASSLSSCSLPSDEKSQDIANIQKEEKEAIQNIKNISKTEIENAKKEINSAVTDVISMADTTLTEKLQAIKDAINQEAETTKKDLGNRIQRIENRITKSYIVGIAGTIVGFIGLIIAILAYRKEPRTDIIKVLIAKEVTQNPNILSCIRNAIGTTNNRQQQSSVSSTTTQQLVKREIDYYIYSKKFTDYLENIIKEQSHKSTNDSIENPSANSLKPMAQSSSQSSQGLTKNSYELYAKESNSMQLSSIQSSYQKGKSIYKLILTDPNSNTAQVSLCVEQEDAKERILAYDNQYLEPICRVSRLSSQPTNVEVKCVGTAERIGEEWKVNKQIIVEIK